jgi:hypothetical protein
MELRYLRAYRADGGQPSNTGPMRFVASTENVARDGLSIAADGWQLANYRNNPIVLWVHDYWGNRPPIGRADVKVDGKALLADITFDAGDPFAADIERKYRQGFLSAVSVGWDTLEIDGKKPDGMDMAAVAFGAADRRTITKAELLDISAVPVPGDPNALKERAVRSLLDIAGITELLTRQARGAIPANTSTPKDDEAAAWDASKEVGDCPAEEAPLRRMHAWVDDAGDVNAKSSYKLPHHRADGTLVWNGVAAAMSRLLQSGTAIPDADRRGVYNHLSAHYDQFNKTAPAFRSISESDAEVIWPGTALQMARLYLDMTDDADDDERVKRYRVLERRYRLLGKEAPEFLARAQLCLLDEETIRGLFLAGEGDLLGWGAWNATEQRTGAVLNARMRSDVRQIIDIANGMLARSEKEESEEAARAFLNDLMPRHDVSDWLTQLAG